jgi:predicted nuclease of predicted toxin-antitoxin system
MRFLIDENLSPMLVDLARERGYETMTLRDLGVLNAKDWTLLEKIQNEDWTLVINNV